MKLTKQMLDALKHSTKYVNILCEVDPEAAAELLKLNVGNRPVQKAAVERYAQSMAAGEWINSGEHMTILDGVLISGQKRCLAIIKSGATIEIPIVFGVDRRTRTVIDGVEPRKPFGFSGLERYLQEMLTASYRVAYYGGKSTPSISEAEIMVKAPIVEQARALRNFAPSSSRGVTTAAIRAAFAAGQLEWPDMSAHIAGQYRAMSIAAFERFSPIIGLLYRQLTNDAMPGSGGSRETQRFYRAMYAVDPQNEKSRIIRWRTDDSSMQIDKYRAIIRKHIGLQ